MTKRFLLISALLLTPIASHAGDPLQKVAKDFVKKMRPLHNPRIALLSFPYINGRISSGSSILSERLTTYMAELKGVRVIERSLLKSLLEEQHLSESGVVDGSSAKKIGKILDVDVIVTGTLNDIGDTETELNARALNAVSGEVVAAANTVVEREWPDRPHPPRERYAAPQQEVEEQPAQNEAIEIGYPSGRGGVSTRR